MFDSSNFLKLQSKLFGFHRDSAKVSKELEASFMNTSQHLEEVVESSSKLLTVSQEIIDIATGRGEHKIEFEETFETIESYLSAISGSIKNVLQSCTNTDEVSHILDEIVRLESQLMSTLQPLKTMRVFFKIESAHLSANDRTIFLALVEDIKNLHSEAESITKNEFQKISECQNGVRENTRTVNQEMIEFDSVINSEVEDLDRVKNRLRVELKKNQEVDIELFNCSQRISGFVSEIVTAIQNDDIAAQKTSHVMDVILSLHSKIDEWKKNDFSLDDEDLIKYLVAASKIQKSQISSILNDYAESAETISTICPKIAREVIYLDQECLSLKEFSTLTTSADGVIQVLLDAFVVVETLLIKLVEILNKSYDVIAPLGSLSSEVNEVLENITEDLRVVTINAKIKASKQSSRSGLHPLTENVGSISIETQRISSNIGDKLSVASGQLKELVSEFLNFKNSGDSLIGKFKNTQEETELGLHAIRDSALTKIVELTSDADKVKRLAELFLKSSQTEFSGRRFYHDLSDLMDEIIDCLTVQLSDRIDFSNIEGDEIRNLAEKYTMQEEVANQNLAMGNEFDQLDFGSSSDKENEMIFF